MSLTVREPHLVEMMDDPDCDAAALRRTLKRFAVVNHFVSGWGGVYRRHLRPVCESLGRPVEILDIGCGGGDVLQRLSRLARHDGFELRALGIDPDPRAIEVAHTRRGPGLAFRCASSRELVDSGGRFDIVISNHLLHHLDPLAFETIMHDSEALARALCVHSDIARSRAAYLAFAAAITPLAPGTFLRVDGLRSIRRSFTKPELKEQLPPGWRAAQPSRFRLLATFRRDQRA